MARALIYTRVSQDRAGGRSPAEQEKEAREVCAREGWEVFEVVTDSAGASRHSKGTRDGWTRARQMVKAKKVQVLVTWECSRAQRDLAAYAELRDLCVESGVKWSYSGRTYDLTVGDDRFRTGLDALLAEREADEISERVRRSMRANAINGRPHGRRLFGYERVYDPTSGLLVGQQPHPTEAETVRRIFDRYLAGVGIRTIALELRRDGITTGSGAGWNDAQVRRVLVNPSYTGKRTHKGQIVAEGGWPALVTEERFRLVQDRLAAKRGTRQVKTARLLTAVARCGVCGGRMSVIHDRNDRKMYACIDAYHVARDMLKLDAFVTETLFDRWRTVPAPTNEPVIPSRAAEYRAQLDSAIAEFTARRLSAVTLGKIEAELLPLIAAEERSRVQAVPLEEHIPADVDAWWDAKTPEQRRETMTAWVARVTVHPTVRGRKVFDPTAVSVEFR